MDTRRRFVALRALLVCAFGRALTRRTAQGALLCVCLIGNGQRRAEHLPARAVKTQPPLAPSGSATDALLRALQFQVAIVRSEFWCFHSFKINLPVAAPFDARRFRRRLTRAAICSVNKKVSADPSPGHQKNSGRIASHKERKRRAKWIKCQLERYWPHVLFGRATAAIRPP